MVSTSRGWVVRVFDEARDMAQIETMAFDVYDRDNRESEAEQARYREFPDGAMVLTSGSEVVGWLLLWPIEASAFEQFKAGRLREAELVGERICSVDRDPAFRCASWHVSDIYVVPRLRRTDAVRRLMLDGLRSIVATGHVASRATLGGVALTMGGRGAGRVIGCELVREAHEMADGVPLWLVETDDQFSGPVGRLAARDPALRRGRLGAVR
jgi:hypothetical protein